MGRDTINRWLLDKLHRLLLHCNTGYFQTLLLQEFFLFKLIFLSPIFRIEFESDPVAVVRASYFYVVFYTKFYFLVFSKYVTRRHKRKLLVIEFKVVFLSVLFVSEVNYDFARCLCRRMTYPYNRLIYIFGRRLVKN